jgi:hypothetical protein
LSGTWSAGWAVGDVVTSAEFKKGVGCIYNTTLGVAAASIDVTGINATYAHLRVVLYGRGDTAATEISVGMRFNGDTAANYDSEYVQGNGGTPQAAQTLADTSIACGLVAAASATAGVFDGADFVIPAYAGTTGQKVVSGTYTTKRGTAGGLFAAAFGGWWRSTAAINQITLFPTAGNFVAGTRLSIYAMGA